MDDDNMKKAPFVRYKLDEEKAEEKRRIITVSLNEEEQKALDEDKKILQQSKDSTAIKQLAELGRIVLHDNLTGSIIRSIFDNKRRNARLGISEFE